MALRELFIGFADKRAIGAATAAAAARLGIHVTNVLDGASVMAFSEDAAVAISKKAPSFFASEQALFNLTDRLGMQTLGVPVLPTSLDPKDFSGPIFLKYRRTYKQAAHPLSYTAWNSAEDLFTAAGDMFSAYQTNPDPRVGELVTQPKLPYPTENIDVVFTVNESSDVHFIACCAMSFSAPGEATSIRSVPLPAEIEQRVRKLCKEQNLRGGAHNADFVLYGGEYCLSDWNPRLPMGVALKHASDVGFTDSALLHMCGASVEQQPLKHFEQRGYFDNPLSFGHAMTIRKIGAFPRSSSAGIVRISVVTDNEMQAADVFAAIEALR